MPRRSPGRDVPHRPPPPLLQRPRSRARGQPGSGPEPGPGRGRGALAAPPGWAPLNRAKAPSPRGTGLGGGSWLWLGVKGPPQAQAGWGTPGWEQRKVLPNLQDSLVPSSWSASCCLGSWPAFRTASGPKRPPARGMPDNKERSVKPPREIHQGHIRGIPGRNPPRRGSGWTPCCGDRDLLLWSLSPLSWKVASSHAGM